MAEKYEAPHILTNPINPITDNISVGRILILVLTVSLLTVEIFIFFLTFFSWFWLFFCGFLVVLTISFGWIFGRTEKAYNFHLVKTCQKIRHLRGIECIRKFSEDASEYMVRSFTGWYGINQETGLSHYMVNNEINWSTEKVFDGNWGFTLLAFPPAEDSKEVYNQNLRDASLALPYGCGEKDILISGQDMSFIANDIEELLKDPNISPIRKEELHSIQEKFLDSADYIDWIYLIHIMLPYTQYDEEALKKMKEVQEGYIELLNNMGIETILIKEESDIILIISGMLTGELLFGGVVNGS